MGILYAEPLWSGRTGEDGITRQRSYTQMYEVRTANYTDDPTIAGGGGTLFLPRNGQPYPFDSRALMIKIRPTQVESDPTLWYVACDYSTELPKRQAGETQGIDPATGDSKQTPTGSDPTSRAENPLDRDPVYKITHEKLTEPAEFTWQGIPILNCADDPYDPPLMVQRSLAVATITKNYAQVKFDWLDQFVDAVNATKWNGRNKRTCKIDAIDYEAKYENGVNFWQVVFRIIINRLTWDAIVTERGWNEKINIAGVWTKTPIKIPTDSSGRAGDWVPLLDGAFASGFTYATDNATPVNPNDGSNPAIPGVAYPAAALALQANYGVQGRGRALAPSLGPHKTRWRVQPEKAFTLLGI